MLRDYLKWLVTMPKMLWVGLTDWYLHAGVVTGGLATLAFMLAVGWLSGPVWARALGSFVSLNGALFVAWRVMLRLRQEAEEDSHA